MKSPRGTVRPLPLWARWVLASVVAIGLVAAIVIASERAGPEGSSSEAGAEAEINRVADIAVAEDEAPHFAGLAAGSAATSRLERAIAGNVRQRISGGQLTGPLQGVSCSATGSASAGRSAYRCTVHSAGIAYLFLAVADKRHHKLAWCKVDPPAEANAGPEIPISASCRA